MPLQEELKLCQAEAAQKLSLSTSSEERLKVKLRQLEAEVRGEKRGIDEDDKKERLKLREKGWEILREL